MTKLNSLIDQVDTNYGLKLDPDKRAEVVSRLKFAGVLDEVGDGEISKTVDTIMAIAEAVQKPKQVVTAAAIYSDLKADPPVKYDVCGICGSKMGDVALANTRSAKYCPSCHVVMPVKVS